MAASRTMAVLRAVVEEYVGTCAPVGSRAIVDGHGLGVSPATVRGDLSRLEGSGHLTQPHVSAGRVPTDLGYRAVVDDDLAQGVRGSSIASRIHADSVADAMGQIASALANMTHCLAIVSDPVSQTSSIARISLVRTTSGSAVLVVVCDDGRVESRVVPCHGITDAELAEAESVLSSLYVGKDVSEADISGARLDGLVDEFVRVVARHVRVAVARASEGSRTSAGVSLLLAQPEFRDGDSMRVFVGALEDGDLDFDTLLSTDAGGSLVVRIGSENPDERLALLSFVAKEYLVPSGMGFVACVGPTRMDYRQTIGAVEAGAAQAANVYRSIEG